MRAIIFYSNAEYCDRASKMTIKINGRKTRVEIWSSDSDKIAVKTESYITKRKAWHQFREMIGVAVLGGWKVLNAFPKRETWETKRSK